MDVPDQPAKEKGPLQTDQGLIGLGWKGLIDKLEQNAGEKLEHDQDRGHAAQAEGERETKGPFRDKGGAEVEDEVSEQKPGPFAFGPGWQG